VCAGTTTGLGTPITLGGWATANGAGNASVNANIPPAWCNNRYLQVVDTTSCTTTNVLLIQ
jgi:hypothetical protein